MAETWAIDNPDGQSAIGNRDGQSGNRQSPMDNRQLGNGRWGRSAMGNRSQAPGAECGAHPAPRTWHPAPACRLFTCVQIVPVHQRVEAQDERALGLPAPERTNREHHDVALADGRVDDLRTVLEVLAAERRRPRAACRCASAGTRRITRGCMKSISGRPAPPPPPPPNRRRAPAPPPRPPPPPPPPRPPPPAGAALASAAGGTKPSSPSSDPTCRTRSARAHRLRVLVIRRRRVRRRARSAAPARRERTGLAADAEERTAVRLVVDRQVIARNAVDDRARAVGDDAAIDRAGRDQALRPDRS